MRRAVWRGRREGPPAHAPLLDSSSLLVLPLDETGNARGDASSRRLPRLGLSALRAFAAAWMYPLWASCRVLLRSARVASWSAPASRASLM